MPTLAELLRTNPRGWGKAPPGDAGLGAPADGGLRGISLVDLLRPSPAEMRNQPSEIESMLNAGSMPAKLFTDAILMQPVRAGEAVGEAAFDPTLANVTNAGAQTALAVGKPLAALGVLGGGGVTAAARDLGVSPVSSAEAAAKTKKAAAKVVELPGLTPEQQGEYADAVRKIQAEDYASGAQRRLLENTVNGYRELSLKIQGTKAQNEADLGRAAEGQKQQEYGEAVDRSNAVRESVLARDVRSGDTELGKFYNKNAMIIPMAAAGIGGAIPRLATGPGKSLMGKVLKDYAGPMLSGAGFSFGAMNAPLFADMNAPAYNPEKEALMKAAFELPDGHPKKQEMLNYARALQDENPVRKQAYTDFYDNLGKRLGVSALEGATFGKAGASLVGTGGRMATALRGEGGGGRPGSPWPAPQGPSSPILPPNPQGGPPALPSPAGPSTPSSPTTPGTPPGSARAAQPSLSSSLRGDALTAPKKSGPKPGDKWDAASQRWKGKDGRYKPGEGPAND